MTLTEYQKALIERLHESAFTEDDVAILDLVGKQADRIEALEAKCALYAASLAQADKDTDRLDWLIVNIRRYRLYESKGYWFCVPVTAQDWQEGHKSAREAIDAAMENTNV